MSAVKEYVTIEVEFKNPQGAIIEKALIDCEEDLVEASVKEYISKSDTLSPIADSITWKGRMTMNNENMNGYRVGVIEKAISLPDAELGALLTNIGEQLTSTELRKIAEGKYQEKIMGPKSKILKELQQIISDSLSGNRQSGSAEQPVSTEPVTLESAPLTEDILVEQGNSQPISENMKTVDKL